MSDKTFVITLCSVLFVFLIWVFGWPIYRYNTSPRHKVLVEWTVYTASGSRSYSRTFSLVGEEFAAYKSSSRGSNTVDIKRTNVNSYIGDEWVCIYNGTSDVDINKIKIVE